VTPSQNDCFIIACCATADTVSSIDSSYTITDSNNPGGIYGAAAYLVQTTAGATDPSWTQASSGQHAAANYVFKAAAGGGGTTWPGYIAPFGWN